MSRAGPASGGCSTLATVAVARPGHGAGCGHGFFEDMESGVAGIVLELVSGEPLADVLRSPRLTLEHRAGLLDQLASALAHVHKAGLVHRDLKPDNVLVTESFWTAPYVTGTVKLVDFGIAAEVGNPRPLTATGAIIGTVPYLAPEILAPKMFGSARGSDDGAGAGFMRDVFAFGVLGAELLLERHPTGLSTHARGEDFVRTYREAAEGRRPWPPPELYGSWGPAIRACLALEPSRRPRSGIEIVAMARSSRTEPRDQAQHELSTQRSSMEGDRTSPMTLGSAPPLRTEPGRPLFVNDGGPHVPSAPSAPVTSGRSASFLLAAGAMAGAGAASVLIFFLLRDGDRPEEATPKSALLPSPTALRVEISSDPPPSLRPSPPSAAAVRDREPLAGGSVLLPDPAEVPKLPTPLLAGADAPSSCPQPCCGGVDCASSGAKCASSLSCVPGSCNNLLDRSDRWLIRVGVAREDKVDLLTRGNRPNAKVCLRHSGARDEEWVCTSLSALRSGESHLYRLEASTQDLIAPGIDIEVRDKRVIASSYGAVKPPIKVTALCRGLVYDDDDNLKSFTLSKYEVVLHLDRQ